VVEVGADLERRHHQFVEEVFDQLDVAHVERLILENTARSVHHQNYVQDAVTCTPDAATTKQAIILFIVIQSKAKNQKTKDPP